jgi:hypothetical protein
MVERTCDDCVMLEWCRPFVHDETVLYLCPECYDERVTDLQEAALQLLAVQRGATGSAAMPEHEPCWPSVPYVAA